jgi:2-oxoisovalerate dehydrogenase E1 component
MRNAMRSEGVTMYLEPKFLYNFRQTSASVPGDDFIIPFGRAKVRRSGTDVTIVTYGNATHICLDAASKLSDLGYSAEVIDLRSLRPWDRETVCASAKKTSRVVVAHEHYLTGGMGGEIASVVTSECFRWLDAPVARVASKDVPVGFAKNLEKAILLNAQDVVDAAKNVLNF